MPAKEITDLFIYNGGNQYTSLPIVSVKSDTGTNGSVRAYGDDIGKIVKIKTVELPHRLFSKSILPIRNLI